MAHPQNAAFVSKDGLASFDEYGRKLDSNGNVAWGDYQSLRGAGAQPRQEYWDRKFEAEMAAMGMAPQPAAVEAAPSRWRDTVAPTPAPASALSTSDHVRGLNLPMPEPAPASVIRRGAPAQPPYNPLPIDAMEYVRGLNLPMPDNAQFDPYTAPPVAPVAPPMQGVNNRPMQTSPGTTPMPTRDFRPQAMAAPAQPPMGTLMPPARPPMWSPYAPYGVTAPLPGVSSEDEMAINQAVLWR